MHKVPRTDRKFFIISRRRGYQLRHCFSNNSFFTQIRNYFDSSQIEKLNFWSFFLISVKNKSIRPKFRCVFDRFGHFNCYNRWYFRDRFWPFNNKSQTKAIWMSCQKRWNILGFILKIVYKRFLLFLLIFLIQTILDTKGHIPHIKK